MISNLPPQPPMFNEKMLWTRAISVRPTTVVSYLHMDNQLFLHLRHVTKATLREFPCIPPPKFVIKSKDEGNNVYDLLIPTSSDSRILWMGEDVTIALKGDLDRLLERKEKTCAQPQF